MNLDSTYWESLSRGDRLLLTSGVAGIVVLLFWHFGTANQAWPTQPIGVLVTDGSVKRRPSRSLNWQWIEGKGTVFLRDTVFSPPDTRSTVRFHNGTEMLLEPNTMVRFSEVQNNKIDVALLRGDVSVTSAEGVQRDVRVREQEKTEALTIPLAKVSERTERLRRIVAQRLRQLPDLDAGSIPLSEPFPDPKPLEYRWNELRKRTMASLSPPRLGRLREITTEPATRSVSAALTLYQMKTVYPKRAERIKLRLGCVRLLWTPVPVRKVSYYLEISRDRKFRYVRSYGTTTNEIALRLNDATLKYYWRVRAVYGSESIVTPVTPFEVIRPSTETSEQARKDELKTLPTWEVCDQM